MSSVSGPSKSSCQSYSSLSCVSKRPSSSAFNSDDAESLKVVKQPTIGAPCGGQPFSNHHGSGVTLDDTSSLIDQSPSVVSPTKSSSTKSSLIGSSLSQSDLIGINYKLTTLTINQRESIYVRTLFRYDPATDRGLAARGLAFEHGDILYVVNASDPEWWQARYVFPISTPAWASAASIAVINSNSIRPSETSSSYNSSIPNELSPKTPGRPAIIPGQRRVERRNKFSSKRVKFVGKEMEIIGGGSRPWNLGGGNTANLNYAVESNRFIEGSTGGNPSFPAAFVNNGDGRFPVSDSASIGGTLERRKKTNSNSLFKRFSSRRGRKDLDDDSVTIMKKKKSVSLEDMQTAFGTGLSRTYEIVRPVTLTMARPLIIFGPLKERITEGLLRSDEFATCPQHTSRPPQIGEVDGVNYHFYPSKATMQVDISSGKFLDVVVQSDHFYATSMQSIIEVLRSGRVCILDVNIMAIYQLQIAGLHPMSILLKPETVMQCRGLQRRLTVDQARKMHDACAQMEAEYWYLFTAILNLESLDSALASVSRVLQQHKGPQVWLPVDQTLHSAD